MSACCDKTKESGEIANPSMDFVSNARKSEVQTENIEDTVTLEDGTILKGFFACKETGKGEGTITYENGDVFSGSWINFKATGKGKYQFDN